MNENELPVIECQVTFLPESEGGRRSVPILSSSYCPHLVVGDFQRQKDHYDSPVYEYLGVAFLSGQNPVEFNQPLYVQLVCIYYPNIDYSQLVLGATFTIREGHRIVGYGEVVRCGLVWDKVKKNVSPHNA